ncbi:type II secretion system F family protein [Paracandidimonas lactea]|uniref:type II secretion system F family protein n=1 Tax=Paracandidimonas lactea TaxID=2895524 RepID=UPI001F1EBB67|nr:type II secretion system F family protein [Paracandidimonas lactea]
MMFIAFCLLAAAIAGITAGWLLLQTMSRGWSAYRRAFGQDVANRMDEFFLFFDPSRLLAANLLVSAASATLGFALLRTPFAAIIAGGLALAAPRWLVAAAHRRRLRRFDAQLPDLLMGLAGALRAGMGLQAALRQVVAQSAAPLCQEFGLLLRQQRMGVSWDEALKNLRERTPTEGGALVVSALAIASRSGGAVAQSLDTLASTMRTRQHLDERVRALTSQGRMQAWLMAGLAPAVGMALYHLDPDAMRLLWETPLGWAALGLITVLTCAGMLLVRRIVAIDV